jgi:CRISPR/Cas system-associated endoribonuclease Cas2
MGVWWRWWEHVHGLLVAWGFALRIVTALRDNGVGNSSSNNKSCSVGRLRVQTSVYERHLLKDQCERIRNNNERTGLRAGVKGISMRGRRRVGQTSFWSHRGR